MTTHSKNDDNNILLAIIIIVVILIFLISLGNLDLSSNIEKEKDRSDESRKSRHKRLKAHIENQKALKQKLTKKFKRIYFAIRVLIVLGWGGIIYLLYYHEYIKSLGDFLDYSQAMLIGLLIVNFLSFGSISNLKNFLGSIKASLENRVWGKYSNIDERIAKSETELDQLNDGE